MKTAIIHDKDTDYIEVENGRLKVVLSSIGAGVWKVMWDGRLINLAPKKSVYPYDPQFNGKLLARVAGRIPCHISINGMECNLNEEQQGFCLHGGKMDSMSFKNFDYDIREEGSMTSVIFTLMDPNGSNGFPGNLKTRISYEFFEGESKFTIRYHATTDKDTIVSFSNHLYWDINQRQDISDDKLYLNASRWGTNDGKSQLVTNLDKVPEYMDFTTPSTLGAKLDIIEEKVWEKTIDHLFVFDDIQEDKPQAVLESNDLRLSLYTDFESMNIYVDNSLTPYEFENVDGQILHKRRAIALEPQQICLGLSHIILRKDETFDHYQTYVIENK